MLKIWLTWLQPSLGVLGMALVISNPLSSTAASKPTVVSNPSKTPTQQPKTTIAKFAGTTIGAELQTMGVAATPDLAVRQLAIDSMATKGVKPYGFTPKPQRNNRDTLASFLSPSTGFQQQPTKAIKPKFVKQSLVAQVTRKISPKLNPTPIVPGLFIGNSDVTVSNNVLPTRKTSAQPIVSTEIGAPTPLSAMMAGKKGVDPFPVVRPELMQKLTTPVVASVPTIPNLRSFDPIASVPTVTSKIANQSLSPLATNSAGIYRETPHSLDPIAEIPSGLQRLLGNNLNNQPIVAAAPVANVSNPKTIAKIALKQLVTPNSALPEIASGASLQLATAQAYTNVPKFDIPGERFVSLPKPVNNLIVVNRSNQSPIVIAPARNSDVVLPLQARRLETYPKQSWTLVGQRSSLGGLILGSQSLGTDTKKIGLLPTNIMKSIGSSGLPAFNSSNVN